MENNLQNYYDNNLKKLREQFNDLGIDAIFLGMCNSFGNYSNIEYSSEEFNINCSNKTSNVDISEESTTNCSNKASNVNTSINRDNSLCDSTIEKIDIKSDIHYFSGFSGSNGRCFISKDKSIISVDGRYVKQANIQVNKDLWNIEKYPDTSIVDIFKEILGTNATLGICLYSLKYSSYLAISEFSKKLNFSIKLIDEFPIINRNKSKTNLILLNEDNIGETISNRIKKIQSKLSDNEALLINDSSMVGWITGLRLEKPTITHSLIPSAAVLITKSNKPVVFCDLNLKNSSNDFVITDFKNFEDYLKKANINTVKCNFNNTYLYFVYIAEKLGYNIINDNSINAICSIKTSTEVNNQKEGALLTSLAMIKVLGLAESRQEIYIEESAADLFYETLNENKNFVDFSFDPISASGNNTAIVHYNHKSAKYTQSLENKLFLFDCGAHFKYSTTDMTRTIYIGEEEPNNEIKKQYTLVLKSIINFSMLKFPNNIKAGNLDFIARSYLWQHGYTYSFGTGHGVSAFGNVHEYPSVSPNSNDDILENMIVTIEPGIYTENTGIRMENMLLVKKSKYPNINEFETINYIPFSKKLIVKEMLSNDEINWLNKYHCQTKDFCIKNGFGNIYIQKWIEYNTEPL